MESLPMNQGTGEKALHLKEDQPSCHQMEQPVATKKSHLLGQTAEGYRSWRVHRLGGVCKLHLLNKRYKVGDNILCLLDFADSKTQVAKYIVMLQSKDTKQYELKQEFSLGLERSEIMITIPNLVVAATATATTSPSPTTPPPVLQCVLSFLFYITDKDYPKRLFQDKAGIIEIGPKELDTKLFSCDFPIAIHSS